MREKRSGSKKLVRNAINAVLISILLLLIFVPGAKAWMLRQMITVGFFKATIDPDIQKVSKKEADLSFSFKDANGLVHSLNDYKGKVVFINFWASWCPPCLAEMPSLQKLYNECENDKDLVFLFINEDGQLQKGIDYLSRNEFSMPVFSLASQPPTAIYSGTLPTTVVLDKQGQIILKEEGIGNYYTPAFIQQLRALQ